MPNALSRLIARVLRPAARPNAEVGRGRAAGAAGVRAEGLEERRLFVIDVTPFPGAPAPAPLANGILVPNSGITITGGTWVGQAAQGGTYTGFDIFTPFGLPTLNIGNGVILSTGSAAAAEGPNDALDTTTAFNTPGDAQLNLLAGFATQDAVSWTINFTTAPGTQSVMFDFVFGTEELPEFVGTLFNDVFGAYLDGQQVSFDVNGRPISLNNNLLQVSNLFGQINIEFDGLTTRVRTRAPLNPSLTTHTLKFAIADTGTATYDSAVFISRLQGSAQPVAAPATAVPDPGTFVWSSPNYAALENGGTATLTVERTGGTSGIATVDYAITGGTATGFDFTGATGTLVFQDGQASQTLTVPVIDDALVEGDETVNLTLSNPVDAQLGTQVASTLTIEDNERAVSFSPQTYTVNEDAGSVTLTLTRSGGVDTNVTVDYTTATGTAVSPTDYSHVATKTAVIPAGQKTTTVTIPIGRDYEDFEAAETFTVSLANPTNAGVGTQGTATVTIENVDRATTLYDIQAYAPRGRIEALLLYFNDALEPIRAQNPDNYDIYLHNGRPYNAPPTRRRVALRAAEYRAETKIVVLRPVTPMRQNVFYEVDVRTNLEFGVISSGQQLLDGDYDGIPGGDVVSYFGRGSRLNYYDHNGDWVRLGAQGGVMEVFRDIDRDARVVRLIDPSPTTLFFGKIAKRVRTSDGLTRIDLLYLGSATNQTANPPIEIGFII